MTPSLWLSYVKENALSNSPEDPALWTEMLHLARQCCQGQAEVVDWVGVARHLSLQLRGAYTYLRKLERKLPADHPGLPRIHSMRELLLAMREALTASRQLLPAGPIAKVEQELLEVRKGLLSLGQAVARLDQSLDSLHCPPCKRWQEASLDRCSHCGGRLTAYGLSRDDTPKDQYLAPEYARLRELADRVHSHPLEGEALRRHALQIAELLKATEKPTRGLAQTHPEAPVDEMVEYLRAARAAVMEMAEWPTHQNYKRLETGWILLRDQLGRFEQGLEDFVPA
jgi:hypothetical protein